MKFVKILCEENAKNNAINTLIVCYFQLIYNLIHTWFIIQNYPKKCACINCVHL